MWCKGVFVQNDDKKYFSSLLFVYMGKIYYLCSELAVADLFASCGTHILFTDESIFVNISLATYIKEY